jgi:nicotinamidase-related amidase
MTQPLDVNAALILIDIQAGMDDPSLGPRNNPDAEQNAARLLEAWRAGDRPLVHNQHPTVRPD